MARFFISHSATKGSRSEAVLNAVQKMLADHEVFAQERIREGEEWRSRIYDELARCHGAIVLLDERAVRQDAWWVRREVYNLLWRQYLGVVRIQAVQLDELGGQRSGELGLGELREHQWVRAQAINDPADVAAAAVAPFADLKPVDDGVMASWLRQLTDLLSKIEQGDTLDHFATRLGVDPKEWGSFSKPPECYRFLAGQLLGTHAAENISTAVKSVRHVLLKDRTVELARRATPALVDAEAAAQLLRSVGRAAGDRPPVLVLNADYWSTAQLYIRRAGCCSYGFRHAYISVAECGEDAGEDFDNQLGPALRKLMCWRRELSRERLLKRLADVQPTPNGEIEAGFLVVRMAGYHQFEMLADRLADLQDDVPWLALVVLIGDTADDWIEAEDRPPAPAFEIVRPLLEPGAEDNIDGVLGRLAEDIGGEELFDVAGV